MKKRFTDCDIWNDPWFRKLSPLHKEFWRFLYERCDAAGVWKIDMEGASFFLGETLNEEAALAALNQGKERVQKLGQEEWFLTGFIEFQYGVLSPACRPHIPVLALLQSHGITLSKGYPKGIHTLEEEERDKDKEQEPSSEKGKEEPAVDKSVGIVDNFNQFWKAYPRKVGKAAALKSWKTKKPPLDKCLRTLSLLVKTEQWTREDGRYIPHPATWLNQGRWDDVPEGFEEFTCGNCQYVGSLRKGFRGRAKCPRCGNETLVGVNQEEL